MVDREQLAITVDTLYTLMHHWDSDSDEFPALERALDAVAHTLRIAGQVPIKAELREMPYSEVCCHMRVAGRLMWVEPVDGKRDMAQLYCLDGKRFSIAITKGEAGLHLEELKVQG